MSEKPTGAFVLGLIGGIFILLNAVVWFAIGNLIAAIAAFIPIIPFDPATAVYLIGGIALLCAIVVIAGSVMMFAMPNQHVIGGVLVLLFSIVSLITLGGFFIGFILGLVGGILGIVWKPTMAAPMMPPPMAPPQP